MAIRSLKTGLFSRSGMVGNPIILPGDYESIATITVGATSVANINFSNIPNTYTHLQVRGILRDNENAYAGQTYLNINGITSGGNTHYTYAQGSLTASGNLVNSSVIWIGTQTASLSASSLFANFIVDILDYTSTNKHKVIRVIQGWDNNGASTGQDGGQVWFGSGYFPNTGAITSLSFRSNGNLVQYSSLALYGIRG